MQMQSILWFMFFCHVKCSLEIHQCCNSFVFYLHTIEIIDAFPRLWNSRPFQFSVLLIYSVGAEKKIVKNSFCSWWLSRHSDFQCDKEAQQQFHTMAEQKREIKKFSFWVFNILFYSRFLPLYGIQMEMEMEMATMLPQHHCNDTLYFVHWFSFFWPHALSIQWKAQQTC